MGQTDTRQERYKAHEQRHLESNLNVNLPHSSEPIGQHIIVMLRSWHLQSYRNYHESNRSFARKNRLLVALDNNGLETLHVRPLSPSLDRYGCALENLTLKLVTPSTTLATT